MNNSEKGGKEFMEKETLPRGPNPKLVQRVRKIIRKHIGRPSMDYMSYGMFLKLSVMIAEAVENMYKRKCSKKELIAIAKTYFHIHTMENKIDVFDLKKQP